jgi:uncharacterized protein
VSTDIDVTAATKRLSELLANRRGVLKIALSGGIDSITLMTIAHRVRNEPTIAVHAVSPAVPPQATRRCKTLAQQWGWELQIVDAGEFADAQYRANPANRCYFCKSNLFDAVLNKLADSADTVATGTNCDDLTDYRPGLQAAAEHDVWQPFVHADIDKTMIRAIADTQGLGKLAQLPAQPCLSSRIETGIAIDAADLNFVNHMERLIGRLTGQGDNRCRITADGVVIQLPEHHQALTDNTANQKLSSQLERICHREQRHLHRIEPYRKGSAFLVNISKEL